MIISFDIKNNNDYEKKFIDPPISPISILALWHVLCGSNFKQISMQKVTK